MTVNLQMVVTILCTGFDKLFLLPSTHNNYKVPLFSELVPIIPSSLLSVVLQHTG